MRNPQVSRLTSIEVQTTKNRKESKFFSLEDFKNKSEFKHSTRQSLMPGQRVLAESSIKKTTSLDTQSGKERNLTRSKTCVEVELTQPHPASHLPSAIAMVPVGGLGYCREKLTFESKCALRNGCRAEDAGRACE